MKPAPNRRMIPYGVAITVNLGNYESERIEIEVAGGSLPAAMERKIAAAQSLIEQQQKSIQRNRRILNGLQDSIKAQNSYLPYFQSLGAFILALEPGQKATFARAIDDCPPLPVIEAFLGGFTTGLYWEHKFSLEFLAIELATIGDVC